MSLYVVLLHLAGAIALLLWAVRMVRTGVERSQRPMLTRLLREGQGGRVRAAAVGAGIAICLQSATAVALLAAGFAATGALSLPTGLAMMLGADLGSAIVVQILSVDLTWLMPVLLVSGALLFFRGTSHTLRQGGRILIGTALILISLGMVGQATLPLREAPVLGGIAAYLSTDFVTAFLLGAAFTWLVHSSVAAILLVATFAMQGVLPGEVAISLVLGANLGGGLIAMGLTRGSALSARHIVTGNFLFRALGAVVALLVVNLLHPPLALLSADPAQLVVRVHLLFNLVLLVLCLPMTGPVSRLVTRLVRSSATPELPHIEPGSYLDRRVFDQPALALASAKRELLRMAEIIERMLGPVMELYESGDAEKIKQIKRLEDAVDSAQVEIKLYLSQIRYPEPQLDDSRRGRDLANFVINLEYVGDAISKTLLKLAETRRDQKLKFSAAGWRELNDLHFSVMQNMQLALNVLLSEDRESARLLIAEKEAVLRAERKSAEEHLRRLGDGSVQSLQTSNIHLETVRTLKTINSLFASVAYPILARSGDLHDSRLIDRH